MSMYTIHRHARSARSVNSFKDISPKSLWRSGLRPSRTHGAALDMQHRLCELIVDRDSLLVPGQRGSTARVDLLHDGFCVTVAGKKTMLPATASGFTRAATSMSAAALARVRRRGSVADLFAHDVVDVASVSRVKRLLWRMWAERAVRINPACAPLMYSRRMRQVLVVCGTPAFLRAPWLLDDALRFRAARAVLLEVTHLVNRTLDVWVSCSLQRQLEEASRWRHLLCPEGIRRVPRALHVTLERFNVTERALSQEALDPRSPRTSFNDDEDDIDLEEARLDSALRALQHITLVRPIESYRHLLVLSGLGRALTRQPPGALEPRSAFLQRLDTDAIDDGIDAFARALGRAVDGPTLPASLGAYLALDTTVPRGGGLASIARRAIEIQRRRRIASPERLTRLPPVPLPSCPGVRFLAHSADVYDEGDRMHHCVAARTDAAMDGQAFLFHVERDSDTATIEVDARGRVVEAKGPANCENAAVEFGREMLARWVLGFGLRDLLDELSGAAIVDPRPADDEKVDADRRVGAAGGPPVTKDEVVIRTQGELCAALVDVDVPRARLRPFLLRHLPRCLRGVTWLVLRRQADGRAGLVVLDPAGRVVASLGRVSDRPRRGHGQRSDRDVNPLLPLLPTLTESMGAPSKDMPTAQGEFNV